MQLAQKTKMRERVDYCKYYNCAFIQGNKSVLEGARSPIEHSDVSKVTWVSCPDFLKIA